MYVCVCKREKNMCTNFVYKPLYFIVYYYILLYVVTSYNIKRGASGLRRFIIFVMYIGCFATSVKKE